MRLVRLIRLTAFWLGSLRAVRRGRRQQLGRRGGTGEGVVTIPVVLCPFDDSVQALGITAGPGRCHEAQLSGIAAVTPIFVSRETCDQLSDDGPAGRSLSRPVIAATQVSRRRRDVGGHIGRPIDGHKRVHVVMRWVRWAPRVFGYCPLRSGMRKVDHPHRCRRAPFPTTASARIHARTTPKASPWHWRAKDRTCG